MIDPQWEALSLEFTNMGYDYHAEQIADPDWCARELARKGYSISLTLVTTEYVQQRFGRPPHDPDAFPNWTYQLWGPRYPTRGDHNTYAMPTLSVSAATALFNICRLEWLDRKA